MPDVSRLVITSTADAPAFCKSGAYKQYLAPKENVLFLPHGGESTSLLCQVESDFYYRLATADVGMTPPASAGWPILQSFDSNRAIIDSSEQLEAFLGANHVTSIVLEEQKKHGWPALLAELGLTPIETGGVLLYRVPDQILNTYANASARKMAKGEALANFELLIVGANRYLAERHPLADPDSLERAANRRDRASRSNSSRGCREPLVARPLARPGGKIIGRNRHPGQVRRPATDNQKVRPPRGLDAVSVPRATEQPAPDRNRSTLRRLWPRGTRRGRGSYSQKISPGTLNPIVPPIDGWSKTKR